MWAESWERWNWNFLRINLNGISHKPGWADASDPRSVPQSLLVSCNYIFIARANRWTKQQWRDILSNMFSNFSKRDWETDVCMPIIAQSKWKSEDIASLGRRLLNCFLHLLFSWWFARFCAAFESLPVCHFACFVGCLHKNIAGATVSEPKVKHNEADNSPHPTSWRPDANDGAD